MPYLGGPIRGIEVVAQSFLVGLLVAQDLGGYDVFRFGAEELRNPAHAEPVLAEFFRALFDSYDVGAD